MSPCGTRSAYVNRRCRCEACKEANRLAHRQLLEALQSRPVQDVPHGTKGGYVNWGCRCLQCRQANTKAARREAAVRVATHRNYTVGIMMEDQLHIARADQACRPDRLSDLIRRTTDIRG